MNKSLNHKKELYDTLLLRTYIYFYCNKYFYVVTNDKMYHRVREKERLRLSKAKQSTYFVIKLLNTNDTTKGTKS